jgi:hypothetical protein
MQKSSKFLPEVMALMLSANIVDIDEVFSLGA